jgi:hypothetical protein
MEKREGIKMDEIDNCRAQVEDKNGTVVVNKSLFMITGHKMHELSS